VSKGVYNIWWRDIFLWGEEERGLCFCGGMLAGALILGKISTSLVRVSTHGGCSGGGGCGGKKGWVWIFKATNKQ
jgi:hypothetical protein